MIEAFCKWIWIRVRSNGKRFFKRVLLFCTLIMLLFSLAVYFFFLDSLGLGFEDHWEAGLIFALIGAVSGVFLAAIFRRLVSKGMRRALAQFENLRRDTSRQMEALVARRDYHALEDKLMRELNEQRSEQISAERAYLYAQARYPWHMPPMLLERILADESAAQMRGRSKESVFVLLSLPGASALALSPAGRLEPEKVCAFGRKVLMRALAFARSSGMLLVQYSLESSVLVADIPYAASKSLRKRLPSLCRKWRVQIYDLLAEIEEREIVPSCFLHYGDLVYGRMQSGQRSIFIADPQAWQSLCLAARVFHETSRGQTRGVLISQQYGEYANIDCTDPGIAEIVSKDIHGVEGWYLLK